MSERRMSDKRAADERGALRECPFCGGTPEFSQPQVFDGNIYGSLWCRSCGATVYVGPCGEPPYDELEETWNRRHERTCHDTAENIGFSVVRTFTCSECGETANIVRRSPSFCPNCGARVVDE